MGRNLIYAVFGFDSSGSHGTCVFRPGAVGWTAARCAARNSQEFQRITASAGNSCEFLHGWSAEMLTQAMPAADGPADP